MQPTETETETTTTEAALFFARAVLFVRTHGLAGLALIAALYAMGFFSRAQTLGCGV